MRLDFANVDHVHAWSRDLAAAANFSLKVATAAGTAMTIGGPDGGTGRHYHEVLSLALFFSVGMSERWADDKHSRGTGKSDGTGILEQLGGIEGLRRCLAWRGNMFLAAPLAMDQAGLGLLRHFNLPTAAMLMWTGVVLNDRDVSSTNLNLAASLLGEKVGPFAIDNLFRAVTIEQVKRSGNGLCKHPLPANPVPPNASAHPTALTDKQSRRREWSQPPCPPTPCAPWSCRVACQALSLVPWYPI